MVTLRLFDRPLLLGFVLGLVFGIVDILFTWVEPLSDDSISALLRFYGPMFFSWAFVSFCSVRRSGHLWTGVTTGFVVAFGTFCVFYVCNLLRVNLFLAELTGRADWQNMMQRFRSSEFDSLRLFVNVEYFEGAPFKVGVASVIGAVMGLVGGTIARFLGSEGLTPLSRRSANGVSRDGERSPCGKWRRVLASFHFSFFILVSHFSLNPNTPP
jgi:hypothetical protein